MIRTEHEFTLPVGYEDEDGTLHRDGVMRLSRAIDEIAPQAEARVQRNEAYLIVILLSRVVLRIGSVTQITPRVIEQLYARDLAYLQEFYNQINGTGTPRVPASCPRCELEFELELSGSGG